MPRRHSFWLHVRVRFPGAFATLTEAASARGPPSHPHRQLYSHLAESNLSTPSPRAIPGRYPVPGCGPSPPPAPAPPTALGERAQTPGHLARPLRASPLPVPRPSLGGKAGPGRERARRRGQ
ncbi:hypothetical protein NN561_007548 [Cricetulus griseus]